MGKGLVTVFGGSGFLGKHVVRALVKDGWRVRVPLRSPHTAQELSLIHISEPSPRDLSTSRMPSSA